MLLSLGARVVDAVRGAALPQPLRFALMVADLALIGLLTPVVLTRLGEMAKAAEPGQWWPGAAIGLYVLGMAWLAVTSLRSLRRG
ncbi:hypothetical protein PUH89_01270 [Rhodobacter capsulatus]|uniref:Uncharacterized protein n=1 Tax=Rhodobacter capsulatus TaxID=1061 RepID=A0A1G7L9H1_RHOCA|nr:hypothetical protein [Rhodobacter capsulatus]WER09637.1 hypothetical protein PUH89_01270 [Rhodobacter capsulatus]SDF45954.1 hypothetical protein SAMN04244550_02285 [Rhodobacter capsulatus]